MAVMKCRMNLCFAVARYEVLVDIVIELHDASVSETEIYNTRIQCHYIGWVLNICNDNLEKDEYYSTWGNVAPRHANEWLVLV